VVREALEIALQEWRITFPLEAGEPGADIVIDINVTDSWARTKGQPTTSRSGQLRRAAAYLREHSAGPDRDFGSLPFSDHAPEEAR